MFPPGKQSVRADDPEPEKLRYVLWSRHTSNSNQMLVEYMTDVEARKKNMQLRFAGSTLRWVPEDYVIPDLGTNSSKT